MFTIILIKTNGFVVSTRDTEEKAREFVRLARIPKRNLDTASAGGTIAAFIYRENILLDANAPEEARETPAIIPLKEDAMDVRDRFALAALPAAMQVCADDNDYMMTAETREEFYARKSYSIARAMMKERAA